MIYELYIPVGIFALGGVLFPLISLLTSKLIRPTKFEPEKYTTYECSVSPTGDAWIQYDIQYYMFALLFAVFDVETVFLYPWALMFPNPSMLVVVEMLLFMVVLLIGLAYAWKKGALEWM